MCTRAAPILLTCPKRNTPFWPQTQVRNGSRHAVAYVRAVRIHSFIQAFGPCLIFLRRHSQAPRVESIRVRRFRSASSDVPDVDEYGSRRLRHLFALSQTATRAQTHMQDPYFAVKEEVEHSVTVVVDLHKRWQELSQLAKKSDEWEWTACLCSRARMSA